MNIHSRHFLFSIALRHAEKLPAVALVKAVVVGEEIEGGYPFICHILADEVEKLSRYSLASIRLFNINGADIGVKVVPVVKVVLDNTDAADEALPFFYHVPARVSAIGTKRFVHAFKVGFFGNFPFLVEPLRRFFDEFGVFVYFDYLLFSH